MYSLPGTPAGWSALLKASRAGGDRGKRRRAAISPTLHAVLWMGGTILSFCAMAVSVRELSGAHDPFQILFFRSLLGVLVLGLVVARLGPGLLRSPQWGWHAIRHSVHFAACEAGRASLLSMLPFQPR